LLCLNLNAVSPYDVWLSRWRRSDGELGKAAGLYPCLAGHFAEVSDPVCLRRRVELLASRWVEAMPRSFGRRLP
jgi:hypothetical protein